MKILPIFADKEEEIFAKEGRKKRKRKKIKSNRHTVLKKIIK